jgi:O-antigen ligase
MNTGLTAWFRRQSVMALPGALAALALTLPAWRYRVLWHLNLEEIFFELHDVILYLSDLLALFAIAAWWMTPYRRRIGRLPRWLVGALAWLALLATVSALWAPLGWLALYQAARLWLLFGLFLVVATASEARLALAWGLLISGAIQASIGLAQFALQRTLGLHDLGELVMRPEWSGASVITVNGVPTLRAYGLTQHPNLLGGCLLAAVLIGAGLALSKGAPRWQSATAITLTGVSFSGLLVTFSRAAWLGLAIGGLVALALLVRPVVRDRVGWRAARAMMVVLAALGLAFLATQWPLLRPRLGLSVEGVEIRSVDERNGLEASAWTLIGEHPWLGVGYGNFSIALWQRKPPALEDYPIYQPVHRVPFLVLAEQGLPGAALWLILALGPWVTIWRRHKTWPGPDVPAALAAATSGAIAALTVVSWFDFYPWFSQQGRLLMWILWGLWAGSAMSNEKQVISNE